MDRFKYTAERDLELSASLGQIGIYPFNAQTARLPNGLLFEDKKDDSAEYRTDVLSGPTRARIKEDLHLWRSRKRVKTLVKKKARDPLLEYLDRILSRKQDDGAEEWVNAFSGAEANKMIDVIDELGVPELRKIASTRSSISSDKTAMNSEQQKIAQVTGKSTESAKSLQIWFHFLDILCDKKVPASRITWLFKTVNLFNEKKRGEELRLHLFPKASTELISQWLLFRLTEIPRNTASAPLPAYGSRRPPTQTQGSTSLAAETSLIPGLKDKVEKWRRGAALVRYMFEEGLFRTSVLMLELTKMIKVAFGLHADTHGARASPTPSPPVGANIAALSHLKLPESVQLVILTEVLSYVPDAVELGYAGNFYECCRMLLQAQVIRQSEPLQSLALSCMKVCEKALRVETRLIKPVWHENKVGLSWALENIRIVQRHEILPGAVWDIVLQCGFTEPVSGCLALLEWASFDPNADCYEENCYIAALGLDAVREKLGIDLRLVFDRFAHEIPRSESQVPLAEVKRSAEEEFALESTATILAFLLARGVPIDTSIRNIRAGTVSWYGFTDIFGRTEFCPMGLFNAVKCTRSAECDAVSLIDRLLDCDFNMASEELIRLFSNLMLPSIRIRVMVWLLETAPNWVVNLALVPLLRCSFVFRQLLWEQMHSKSVDSILGVAAAKEDQPTDTKNESAWSHKLVHAMELRKTLMGDVEGGRLQELIDPDCVTPTSSAQQASTADTLNNQHFSGHSRSSFRPKNAVSFSLAGLIPEERPSSGADNNDSRRGVGAQSAGQLHISGLQQMEIAGECLRYEEGLRLMQEKAEKLASVTRDSLLAGGSSDQNQIFQALRDLMACRSREDRAEVTSWCLSTLDLKGSFVGFLDAQIGELEDLMNKFVSRKIIPEPDIFAEYLRSAAFMAQISSFPPSLIRFVSMLLANPLKEQYSHFLSLFAARWVARGMLVLKFTPDGVDISKLLHAYLRDENDEERVNLSAWSIASRGWFTMNEKHTTDAITSKVWKLCEKNGGEEVAANLASVLAAWKACETTYYSSKSKLQSPNILDESQLELLARCLSQTSTQVRKEAVNILCGDNSKDTMDRTKLLLLTSCLVTPEAAGNCVESDIALRVLQKIDPLQTPCRGLTLQLLKSCIPSQRRPLASLFEAWQRDRQMSVSDRRFLALCRAAIDLDPIENNALLVENLVLCDGESADNEDTRFVDAWAVLEGARDSHSNYEFLKGAVIRQSSRT